MNNNTMNNKERDLLIWIVGVLDAIEDEDMTTAPSLTSTDSPFIRVPRNTFTRVKNKITVTLKEEPIKNQTLLRDGK